MTAKHRLAKVHWRIGQPLLPEHFHAQEESLRLERQRIIESSGLPFYGVAELVWDELQLKNGIVAIESMLVFLRSGEIIDVPGNTEAPKTFNLAEAGTAQVTLFLLLESGPTIVGSDRVGDDDEEGIERSVQRVTLSREAQLDTTIGSQKFASFIKETDESWRVAPDFIPPLVRVNKSPFFEATVDAMVTVTETFEQLLRDDIHENFLSSENQTAAREALRGLYDFRGMLDDLAGGGIDFHPYTMYRALRRLYVDTCIYREVPPDAALSYMHSGLFPSFGRMLNAVGEQLERTRRERPYTPFASDGGMRSCELTNSAKRARDVFWIIERPSVSAALDVSGVKLASRSRVPVVHTHALRGVPFEALANPPFRHGFSSQVEFYALSPGNEWDHCVKEGKLAFVEPPGLEGLRTFLFWRAENEAETATVPAT